MLDYLEYINRFFDGEEDSIEEEGDEFENPYANYSDFQILQLERDIAAGVQLEPSKRKQERQSWSQFDLYTKRLEQAKANIQKAEQEAQANYDSIQKDVNEYGGENKPAPEVKKSGEGYDVPKSLDGDGLVKPPEGTKEPNVSSTPGEEAQPGDCGADQNLTEAQRKEYSKIGNTLGSTARYLETGHSNTGGAGSVSSGKGDHGGVSYGMYQLPSAQKPAPVKVFINQTKWRQMFEGLEPGSAAFSAKWREVAAAEPEAFAEAQEAYNRKSDFNPLVNKLKGLGIDTSQKCFGFQEMVYSLATQHGPSGGYAVVQEALAGKDVSKMSDVEIIDAVYATRSNTSKWFRSSSKKVQQSVYNRYTRESKINAAQCCGAAKPLGDLTADDLVLDSNSPVLSSGGNAPNGFMDPELVYPLNTRLNEPDFSRLARGISSGTLVDIKNAARVLKVPEDVTEGGTWDEPKSGFAAQYPDNWVIQTHGGVTLELDSTKNKQRFHIWHPSNSFLEIYPSGQWVEKNSNDKYEIVLGNKRTFIAGDNHVTVQGTNNIVYRSPQRDFYEKMKTSLFKENSKTFVEGNEFSHVKLNREIHVEGNELYKIDTDREVFITGNDGKVVNADCKLLVNQNYNIEVKSNIFQKILVNKNTEVDSTYSKIVGVDYNSLVKGNTYIKTKGTTYIDSDGRFDLKTSNDFAINASKTVTINSGSKMVLNSGSTLDLNAEGLIVIRGSGIVLKNSCDGVTISARCWDVDIDGSCTISAPVIELNGLVKIPEAEIGVLRCGSCNLAGSY